MTMTIAQDNRRLAGGFVEEVRNLLHAVHRLKSDAPRIPAGSAQLARARLRLEKSRPVATPPAMPESSGAAKAWEAEKNYYSLLGIAQDASPEQIAQAARRNMLKIEAAYRVLYDARKRQSYDEKLQAQKLLEG